MKHTHKINTKAPVSFSRAKSSIAIGVALALSACVSTESLDRTDDAKAAAKNSLPNTPSAWATVQQNPGDVRVGWLAGFNDKVLTALVDEAQSNNLNLQLAASNIDSARALSRQAASALAPQVNLSAGSNRSGTRQATGSSDQSIGVQAGWELDLWGRIRSGNQAAAQSVVAAEADYKFAQYSIAANVAQAYFAAIEASQQLDIAQQSIDTLLETNRIVKVQYENGLGDKQNLALAEADLANAQDGLVSSKGARRDAIRSLELLLGRYPEAELKVSKQLPAMPEAAPAGLPSELLERRPDLIAAERRIAAAYNKVDQAKAAKLPSISLSGSIGGASNSLGSLLDPGNVAWRAASSLLAPLFDGGLSKAQIDASTADQKAAITSYTQAALSAFGEVETSLDQSLVLRQRVNALTDTLNAAEEALRIANIQFKEGEIALIDVLSIQQRVFSARRNLISIKRAMLSQHVSLNLALGGDWK